MADPSPLIAPDQRRRLQQRYEEAVRLAVQTPRDHARVHDLLAECLRADPGNILYLEALLANLRRWGPARKGWLTRWFGAKRPAEVHLRVAPDLLRQHGSDPAVLGQLATAAGVAELDEAENRYWRAALEIASRDASALRGLARALTRQGRFDEGHEIWRTLSELTTDADEEVAQAVRDLQMAPRGAEQVPGDSDQTQTPTDPAAAIALAQRWTKSGRFAAAEDVLLRAQSASGSDLALLFQREELQIARSAHRIAIARRRAASDPHPRALRLVGQLETEHNRLEIDIYHLRSERHPDDPLFRLELARRLVQAGNYSGAIVRLEEARGDPAIRAAVLVELGECWQQLRQYDKAVEFYRQAIAAAGGEREPLVAALYRLGILAAAMNQPAEARQALERLLSVAPGYKDSRQRLDNLP